MESKKKFNRVGFIFIALAVVIAAVAIIFLTQMTKPQEGAKTIAIEVVHGDKSVKDVVLNTQKTNLADALTENNLVSGDVGEYGLFITTADGETADSSKQEWWCITKNGESVSTSSSDTPIADGEKYELTLTVGY